MSMRQARRMRAVVLCADPESAGSDPESAASVLADLGCRVTCGRFDLHDLDLRELQTRPPIIVVVDVRDHLTLGEKARRLLSECEPLSQTPTLLVTTLHRLSALDVSLGFDDFVLAPLVPAEIYARIRQLDWKSAAFGSDEAIKIDSLHIDVAGHEVYLGGRRIVFTHQEFELLRYLAQNRGRVYSREQLLQTLWNDDYEGGTRTVDIHIRRLRAKLTSSAPGAGNASGLLVTVRNVGYKMR